eukprot:scaffold20513_cov130-Isochrysis_galbana.AAC.4
MGRCRKSVDTWAPLYEESQSRSTTTTPAERLGNHGNSATLAAVHQCSLQQTTAQVPMTFPIASAARRSAVLIPAPGDRPARHKIAGSPNWE